MTESKISSRPFGVTRYGEPVTCFRMENDSGAWVELLDYGCTLRALAVPGRDGALVDVLLGYDTIEDYENGSAYLGAVIGRCANRIGGAKLMIGGRAYQLSANEGENQLHGGRRGFDRYVWSAKCRDGALYLRRRSPDGEEGYPGNLETAVTYRWADGNTLILDFTAFSDEDTVVSLTNHAYFNLAGVGTVDGHSLQILAEEYTETGAGNLPTGRILSVADSPLDFRSPRPLAGVSLDSNFCLPGTGMRTAARLHSPESGIAMELSTTQPGVQVYTADGLDGPAGKAGAVHGPRRGVAIEPQCWPDALNWPAFPSPILRADTPYLQSIAYSFSVRM